MKRVEERLVLKRKVKIFISKFLVSIIILLVGLITIKKDNNMKKIIKENVYEKNIPFIKIKQKYEKYFGNLLSMEKITNKTTPVLSEKINYIKEEKYDQGVKLEVPDNYSIPNLESGVIIYIGEKEKLGNTIIIEQTDGVDTMYANIKTTDKQIYDYVEKGEILGIVNDNKLYLSFQQDGKYLDYKKYI